MTHPQYGKPETWPHRVPEPKPGRIDTSWIVMEPDPRAPWLSVVLCAVAGFLLVAAGIAIGLVIE